jgi:hypothetical protein
VSLKAKSLGSAGSAADLIAISGITNATPCVATFAANHGLKDGDRIAVAGVTGNTAANGIWTLKFTGTNTAQFQGSAGNGVTAGTIRAAQVFDATPTMKGHSGVLQVAGNLVGTLTLTAYASLAEFTANDNSLLGSVIAPIVSSGAQGVTNTNATSASSSTKASSAVVCAATNAGSEYEIVMPYILHATVSAFTSGTVIATVQA